MLFPNVRRLFNYLKIICDIREMRTSAWWGESACRSHSNIVKNGMCSRRERLQKDPPLSNVSDLDSLLKLMKQPPDTNFLKLYYEQGNVGKVWLAVYCSRRQNNLSPGFNHQHPASRYKHGVYNIGISRHKILHSLFDSFFNQPPICRITCEETENHPYLHHEPENWRHRI